MSIVRSINKKRVSLKFQTVFSVFAIAMAVALPQVFHVAGRALGVGTAIGEIFLPMHLPIIFIGLLVGGYAGAVSGLLAPLVSYLLTGMPLAPMLPFMMVELCTYGMIAGALRNTDIPEVLKVVLVGVGGRIVRGGAILVFGDILNMSNIGVASVLPSVARGAAGIVIQLVLIPFLVGRIRKYE